jgi:hypothetical protein
MKISNTPSISNHQFIDDDTMQVQQSNRRRNRLEPLENDEPKRLSSSLKPSSSSPYNSPSLSTKKSVKFDDSLSSLESSLSSFSLTMVSPAAVPPSQSPKPALKKKLVGTLPTTSPNMLMMAPSSAAPSPSLMKKKKQLPQEPAVVLPPPSSSLPRASPSTSFHNKRHAVMEGVGGVPPPPPPPLSPSPSPSLHKRLAALPFASSSPSTQNKNKRHSLVSSLSTPSLNHSQTTDRRAHLLPSLSASSLKSTISVSSTNTTSTTTTASRYQNLPMSSSLHAPMKSSFKSTSATEAIEKRKRVLGFTVVQIREYPIRLAQCSVPMSSSGMNNGGGGGGGPPIGIGWNWSRQGTIPLDMYEEERQPQRQRRPTEEQLWLSSYWRTIILKDQGISEPAMERATVECELIRARREASLKTTIAGQVCANVFQKTFHIFSSSSSSLNRSK